MFILSQPPTTEQQEPICNRCCGSTKHLSRKQPATGYNPWGTGNPTELSTRQNQRQSLEELQPQVFLEGDNLDVNDKAHRSRSHTEPSRPPYLAGEF